MKKETSGEEQWPINGGREGKASTKRSHMNRGASSDSMMILITEEEEDADADADADADVDVDDSGGGDDDDARSAELIDDRRNWNKIIKDRWEK